MSTANGHATNGANGVHDEHPISRLAVEIWESEATRPPVHTISDYTKRDVQSKLLRYLPSTMQHPFLPRNEIKEYQFERIKAQVERAYRDIPVYTEKYDKAGFHPSQLKTEKDIAKIPIITKAELIAAFPDKCLHPSYPREELYPTRSSGSSGQTLLIRVDNEAIYTDTVQGIRQMSLQSGLKYGPHDLLTHVYTVPWWFGSVGEAYPAAFISSVIPPPKIAEHLGEMKPKILSLYPSNLQSLLPYANEFKDSLYLAITHSEYSSRADRDAASKILGCPVLDEYSSEEATRMALELPCGHYHIVEDAVRLEVVHPETLELQEPGQSGLAVITNLLNDAMPFIRYLQGDLVTAPAHAAPCSIQWDQLESIDGRLNDAFITKNGQIVPAGTILDITYRWMFDRNINLDQFEMIQVADDQVVARFIPSRGLTTENIIATIDHLENLFTICMQHPVHVTAEPVIQFPPKTGKRRPIRREVSKTV